jgi:hypothetical protein
MEFANSKNEIRSVVEGSIYYYFEVRFRVNNFFFLDFASTCKYKPFRELEL